MWFLEMIGWAFTLGCAVAAFLVPIAVIIQFFSDD